MAILNLDATLSTDSDGTIESYVWKENGTIVGEGITLALSDLSAGLHTFELTVTDSDGLSDTDTIDVTVSTGGAPVVIINSPTAGQTYSAPGSIIIQADAFDSDTGIDLVEFYAGETLIGSDFESPYEFVWNNVAAGDYVLTVKARNFYGAIGTSDPVNVSVIQDTSPNPLQITITSPSEQSVAVEPYLDVEGTFSGPENSGITVNGVLATKNGNHFYASIPLEPSSNIITATLISYDDRTASHSISVSNFSPPSNVLIETGALQGLAPFKLAVKIVNNENYDVEVSWNGTQTYTVAANSEFPLESVVSTPGFYFVNISVQSEFGLPINKNIKFVVQNEADIDHLLKNIWNDLMLSLSDQNNESAISHFGQKSKEKYALTFETLKSDLPQIVQSFSSLQNSEIHDYYAEYAINREIDSENMLFFIYFEKNSYGIWKIKSM